MSKTRYINTKFWDDEYIVSLSPIEKLLFLYFLTNTMTNIAGCYEITEKRILFDTGIDYDSLSKAMDKFKKDKKIFYIDGWIFIKNFIKNQSMNSKVKEGIRRILEEIDGKVKGINIDYDRLYIDYEILNSNSNSNSNLNIISNSDELQVVDKKNPIIEINKDPINQIIDVFYKYSGNRSLFANKTQRKALDDLSKKHSFEEILAFSEFAIKCNSKQYAPTITTPCQLRDKLGQLRSYAEKIKDNSQSNKIIEF